MPTLPQAPVVAGPDPPGRAPGPPVGPPPAPPDPVGFAAASLHVQNRVPVRPIEALRHE